MTVYEKQKELEKNLITERLQKLIEKSQLTWDQTATATNIPVATLRSYTKGNIPSFTNIVKLADFFAVPLDFLAGRCSEETANNILDNYNEYFMQLRRAPYEAYLKGRRRKELPSKNETDGEEPWPYNLIDTVLPEPLSFILREENIKGLEQAIGTLTEREEAVLLMYYRDGNTIEKIADQFDVTRERIRQIMHRGLRKLAHPRRKNMYLNGFHTFEEVDNYAATTLNQREQNIIDFENRLTEREKDISAREEKLNAILNNLFKQELIETTDYTELVKPIQHTIKEKRLEDLDLTVRTYNCVKRAGIDTIEELAEMLTNDPEKYVSIRNLGRTSAINAAEELDKYYNTNKFTSTLIQYL